jgi:heme/copper-type cytochrome/quinol oxidase subunit 1
MLNGFIAIAMTTPVLLSGSIIPGAPELQMSKIIAGGGAGTWLVVGYFLFLIVGVCVVFLCGAAYYLIAQALGRDVYSGKLAGAQLVMMEAGSIVALGLLYYAGFVAGTMFIEKIPAEQVHPFLANFIDPIGVFIAIGLLGALIGGVNYVLTLTKGRQITPTSV